jgi:NDP-sugar pyrophosphorylase family protein
MAKTLSAYFLCAGYGMRLRPLTDRIPKPALTFQGRTALEINFRKVQALLPEQRLCNTHHLYEEMEKPALRLGLQTLYEKDILGTAGCLWNARHILTNTDLFLVHNGDLIHNIDVKDLVRRHVESGHIATLAGLFRPSHNTLCCDGRGRLLGVHGYEGFSDRGELARLTFAGIAVYNREFLEFARPGPEDIKRYWMDALGAHKNIGVVNYSQDAVWYDFGTPQGLWDAARYMMEETRQYSYQYSPLIREERPYVSNEAGMDDLPEALRNVIIAEESAHPVMPNYSDCIIGRDFRWAIKP